MGSRPNSGCLQRVACSRLMPWCGAPDNIKHRSPYKERTHTHTNSNTYHIVLNYIIYVYCKYDLCMHVIQKHTLGDTWGPTFKNIFRSPDLCDCAPLVLAGPSPGRMANNFQDNGRKHELISLLFLAGGQNSFPVVLVAPRPEVAECRDCVPWVKANRISRCLKSDPEL